MTKVLSLIFKNESGKTRTISVYNPKDELEATEVKAAMEAIIAADVFLIGEEGLATAEKAQYRSTDTEIIYQRVVGA